MIQASTWRVGRRAAVVALVVAASGILACRSSRHADDPGSSTAVVAESNTVGAGTVNVSDPAADIFHVQLRPPVFRWVGNARVTLEQGVLQAGERNEIAFTLPKLARMTVTLFGDSSIRYVVRSPSGRAVVPGETPEGGGYRLLANGATSRPRSPVRVWILALEHPEAGEWNVTVDATASSGRTEYFIDVRADDPIVEAAHLEVMPRDGNPRVVNRVAPGEPVYVRVFVATDDRPVAGVRWQVRARTPAGASIRIPVMDDGLHADGAAGDGIFVGAILAEDGPDGFYALKAEGRTPRGVRHRSESRVEVEARGDLLIADTIAVSPDPRVGNPVTLTVTVRNEGTRDFRDVKLDFLLTLGTSSWEQKDSRQTFDLRAGETRKIATTWIPTSAHDYGAQLTIEPWLEPSASDFANNTRRTTVRVR